MGHLEQKGEEVGVGVLVVSEPDKKIASEGRSVTPRLKYAKQRQKSIRWAKKTASSW
jgi:hypothetical protein